MSSDKDSLGPHPVYTGDSRRSSFLLFENARWEGVEYLTHETPQPSLGELNYWHCLRFQQLTDFLEIFTQDFLFAWIAQDIGGMDSS
jgi:hypothetical protein